MSTISVQDIQRDLLAFLRRVEAGESFLVVSGQRPMAEIRPVAAPASQPRPFGLCAGQFVVPSDFDSPLWLTDLRYAAEPNDKAQQRRGTQQ